MSATVLVVEDEPAVAELVSFHLGRAGFRVRVAHDGESAWPLLAGSDLLVLDWMLPGGSGLELLRRLRLSPSAALPVLMLTARGSERDRVEGLESGADDYLTKPFGAAELTARVRALLRRAGSKRIHQVGSLRVDEEQGRVSLGGCEVELTRREFELLACLAASPGRIFGRSELLDRVWGEDFIGTERTVDQHVAQLRSSLGAQLIETVRGRGYRLSSSGGLEPKAENSGE
jgi:DNA-binding response OmpR family regulator